MHVPKNICTINTILKQAGYQCYIVGGAVRNTVAGIPPTDYDLATDAPPQEVQRLFHRTVPTGIDHGTVTILLGGGQYEITTFRTESTYSDSRHPDKVEFSSSIEEDLSRRDFTMNALAWNVSEARLIDLYEGADAIRSGMIIAIGSPAERFFEDPLRILRACRFAAQLGFTVENATKEAAVASVQDLRKISCERVRDEFSKLVMGKFCAQGLFLLRDLGILPVLFPELHQCTGVFQKGSHAFDVFEHSVYACEGAPEEDIVLRLAALFHDLGKPASAAIANDGTISFHGHETIGADITRKLMSRLKYPKQIIRDTLHLVRQHMFNYTDEWTDAAVRRFIARVGTEHLENLIMLRRADSYGLERRPLPLEYVKTLQSRITGLLSDEAAVKLKDLAVNGSDLMEQGIPAGPLLGVILDQLLETVLDDPEMNTREKLIPLAKNLYRELRSRES
ncbi:HD domain-containing protein [Marispirochaeta sp.]|jgi:tRNA nucleotidyltransferase (CCA-adding enzyme)|uniref:CCA tRNA nucleotidyltransferase n=1 Tax=Marispirochaeta sp. TaxID=2038653 RepID=UPI0029C96E6C|nr:HD domain-containing protein [Marispirochaeta sp.]